MKGFGRVDVLVRAGDVDLCAAEAVRSAVRQFRRHAAARIRRQHKTMKDDFADFREEYRDDMHELNELIVDKKQQGRRRTTSVS